MGAGRSQWRKGNREGREGREGFGLGAFFFSLGVKDSGRESRIYLHEKEDFSAAFGEEAEAAARTRFGGARGAGRGGGGVAESGVCASARAGAGEDYPGVAAAVSDASDIGGAAGESFAGGAAKVGKR